MTDYNICYLARPDPCKSNVQAEQFSMDLMTIAKADYQESIAYLQRHEHIFHHPCLRPATHLCRSTEIHLLPFIDAQRLTEQYPQVHPVLEFQLHPWYFRFRICDSASVLSAQVIHFDSRKLLRHAHGRGR